MTMNHEGIEKLFNAEVAVYAPLPVGVRIVFNDPQDPSGLLRGKEGSPDYVSPEIYAFVRQHNLVVLENCSLQSELRRSFLLSGKTYTNDEEYTPSVKSNGLAIDPPHSDIFAENPMENVTAIFNPKGVPRQAPTIWAKPDDIRYAAAEVRADILHEIAGRLRYFGPEKKSALMDLIKSSMVDELGGMSSPDFGFSLANLWPFIRKSSTTDNRGQDWVRLLTHKIPGKFYEHRWTGEPSVTLHYNAKLSKYDRLLDKDGDARLVHMRPASDDTDNPLEAITILPS